jgi:hypothetical protein
MGTRQLQDTAMFYGDKPNHGAYDNGIWQHILGIPYIQRIEEASLYKTVIRTLWIDSTVAGWSRTIRERYPHVTQIGLSDHPLSTHISRLDAMQQHAYLSDLNYLDGLMALTDEERQFYSVALPHIPVERVDLPFPIESYETQYGHLRNSEKRFIGLGVGAADNDRNFVSNLLVFKKLQLNNPSLIGVFLSIPEQLLPYCSYWADRVNNVYIHQRNGMDEMYDILSQCELVISLTDRNTPGRLQGEAAFFGIPTVGSNRLELQEDLWPDLSVKPFDLADATDLAQQLLDNPAWGKELAAKARRRLDSYDYESSKKKFNRLFERIKERE